MKVYYSPKQAQHCPEFEFCRGEKVPCFETPERLDFVLQELSKTSHELLEPGEDSSLVLQKIHSPRYLHFLETAWQQWLDLDSANESIQPFPAMWPVRTLRSDIEPKNFTAKLGLYSTDNGTPLVAGSWIAAKAGADAAVTAANEISSGLPSVFCATRPPGHHAGYDFMGGYCFLNNAAIAAQQLLDNGCKQVAILDVDFHHGNGTQSLFYERSDVLYTSLHGDPSSEFPFYLGYKDEGGQGKGDGFNLNLPMVAGTSSDEWFAALEIALKKINAVNSEVLVVSLGLDAFNEDPISNFKLLSSDFHRLGQRLRKEGLPTAFILEGGYATEKLGLNVANVLDGFENG